MTAPQPSSTRRTIVIEACEMACFPFPQIDLERQSETTETKAIISSPCSAIEKYLKTFLTEV